MYTLHNGVKYKQVERVAKVGEKIQVVTVGYGSMYRVGDILTAEKVKKCGSVQPAEAHFEVWVGEYVVLEPATSEQPQTASICTTINLLTALQTEQEATCAETGEKCYKDKYGVLRYANNTEPLVFSELTAGRTWIVVSEQVDKRVVQMEMDYTLMELNDAIEAGDTAAADQARAKLQTLWGELYEAGSAASK